MNIGENIIMSESSNRAFAEAATGRDLIMQGPATDEQVSDFQCKAAAIGL